MKKYTSYITAFLLLTGAVLFWSCQSTKSATASKMLRFNFEKGKGYDYEMIMNVDQEIMGQNLQMDMTAYYSMDVTEDDGTLKTIRTKYDRFKLNMGVMGMSLDVDTDKPIEEGNDSKNPLAILNRVFGSIKGQEFTMKINKEGKVVETVGFKNMGENMVKSLGLDSAESEKMRKQFHEQFNEEKVGAQFDRFIYIFPDKEVKVGDSWTKKTSSTGMQQMGYDSKYTVKEIEGDMVTLDEISDVSMEKEGMKMKGIVNGTIVVDSRSGLVVNADQDMEMKVGGEHSFTMKMKSKIKGKAR